MQAIIRERTWQSQGWWTLASVLVLSFSSSATTQNAALAAGTPVLLHVLAALVVFRSRPCCQLSAQAASYSVPPR